MLEVLSACPALEPLRLFDMGILAGVPTPLQPFTLSLLRVIEVERLYEECARFLLPMIVSQSQEMSVRVPNHLEASEAGYAVLSFIARCKVANLYIYLVSPAPVDSNLARYLSSVPDGRAVILNFVSKPGDGYLQAITHPFELNPEHTPQCSQLHPLYLINGSFQNLMVRQPVETYPLIEKFRFMVCSFNPFKEELLNCLKPLKGNVEYTTELNAQGALYW